MHTILGANGVIGRELSRVLSNHGARIRQVSRNPQKVNATDETRSADLLNAAATDHAVAGSEVCYLAAGLQYNLAVWQEQWPVVMDNAENAR